MNWGPRERDTSRNNIQRFPQLDQNYKHTGPKSQMYSKLEMDTKTQMGTLLSNSLKDEKEKEKAAGGKKTHFVLANR